MASMRFHKTSLPVAAPPPVLALTPRTAAVEAAAIRMLSAALAVEDQRLVTGEQPAPPPAGEARLPAGARAASTAPAKRRTTDTPAVAIIQAHWRRRSSLEETLLSLYFGHLSPFQAEEAARALWGDSLNGAVVSSCVATVRERILAWLRQPVPRSYAHVFVGAIRLKQRLAGRSQEAWVRCAVGVDAAGGREVLGVQVVPAEDAADWTGFARDLRSRGLEEVGLFIGDLDEAQAAALAREFPAARRQVCVFQLERAVLASVPSPQLHIAMELCRALHAEAGNEISRERLRQAVKEFRRHGLKAAATQLERVLPEAVAYGEFPRGLWRQIRTNDTIKRLLSPFRERIRVIGPILEPEALTLLAAAHLREVGRVAWSRRRSRAA